MMYLPHIKPGDLVKVDYTSSAFYNKIGLVLKYDDSFIKDPTTRLPEDRFWALLIDSKTFYIRETYLKKLNTK